MTLQLLPLSLREAERVAVIGVGSSLRGDDGAGPYLVGCLQKLRPRPHGMRGFNAGTAPENLTGEISEFLRRARVGSRCAILVDAADLGLRPGAVRLLTPASVAGESFSTHGLPLSILARYLAEAAGCEVNLLAIQPAALDFGAPLSPAVASGAERLALRLWRARRSGRAHG